MLRYPEIHGHFTQIVKLMSSFVKYFEPIGGGGSLETTTNFQ